MLWHGMYWGLKITWGWCDRASRCVSHYPSMCCFLLLGCDPPPTPEYSYTVAVFEQVLLLMFSWIDRRRVY